MFLDANLKLYSQRERNIQWNNLLKNTPSLQEVKELLIPNIKDLIKEQRLQVLTRGEIFCRVPEKVGNLKDISSSDSANGVYIFRKVNNYIGRFY